MNVVINQIAWLGLFLGISFILSMIIPFPVSLVTLIIILVLLNMYRRKAIMKRMGVGGGIGTGIFGSSSTFTGNGGASLLKYYCMSCGTQHREAACPKCDSKMKRVGS
jgi:hypothetical protein